MASVVLPIDGTFDIARGRNTLRSHLASHHWSPMFGARAAALLTAIGELILYAGGGHRVVLRLEVIEDGPDAGVRLSCDLHLPDDNPQVEKARQRLVRASDTLDIAHISDNDMMRVTATVQVG